MSDEPEKPRAELPPSATSRPTTASNPTHLSVVTDASSNASSNLRRRGSNNMNEAAAVASSHQNQRVVSPTKSRRPASAQRRQEVQPQPQQFSMDFVPSASWFTDHSREDFARIFNGSGQQQQQQPASSPAPAALAATSTPTSGNSAATTPRPQQHSQNRGAAETATTPIVTPRGSALRPISSASRPSPYRPVSSSSSDPRQAAQLVEQHLRELQLQQDQAMHHASPGQRQRHGPRSISPLQRSLDALRRKQAMRMALEDELLSDDDDEDEDDNKNSPDFWAGSGSLSPARRSHQQRPTTSAVTAAATNIISPPSSRSFLSDGAAVPNSIRRAEREAARAAQVAAAEDMTKQHQSIPRRVINKLQSFNSVQEFGEELFMTVTWTLLQTIAAAALVAVQKLGSWLYRVGYFIVFDTIAAAPSQQQQQQQRQTTTAGDNNNNNVHGPNSSTGYPSPFPGFYRDAFFSTWSPHEILEPVDLPMTSAFTPTPLPAHIVNTARSNKGASVAEMLRPTPAPPFWWHSLMEISGRHFIEASYFRGLNDIFLAATLESRTLWAIHEDEVLRGQDLVRRVCGGGRPAVNGNHDDDYAEQQHFTAPREVRRLELSGGATPRASSCRALLDGV